ncbi:MAG: hypothetical protein ACI8QQ_002467 [Psychroserpens sp.]|jgi:hypothetical protein
MIKFSRQIRQNQIMEHKTGKYFKYAIGEIVLVVIGILIAVSINSWNESYKQKQELLNIYAIVLDDLNNDVNQVAKIINFYKGTDSVFARILNDKMTKEDYENHPIYTKIITGYPDLVINKRGYKLLEDYNNHSISETDNLQVDIMQFYTVQLVKLHANDVIILEDVMSNYEDWKNNHMWYKDYISNKNLEGFIDYALQDPDYKNRAANFHFLHHKIYLPILENFNQKAKTMIKQVDEKHLKK